MKWKNIQKGTVTFTSNGKTLAKANVKNGQALTYLYKLQPQLINFFQEDEFSFEKFEEETAIMIYTKKR